MNKKLLQYILRVNSERCNVNSIFLSFVLLDGKGRGLRVGLTRFDDLTNVYAQLFIKRTNVA